MEPPLSFYESTKEYPGELYESGYSEVERIAIQIAKKFKSPDALMIAENALEDHPGLASKSVSEIKEVLEKIFSSASKKWRGI
jgi:hypothetical protein